MGAKSLLKCPDLPPFQKMSPWQLKSWRLLCPGVHSRKVC